MDNNKLEKNITGLSTEYIYNCAVGSFLLLLLSCCEDIGENSFAEKYTVHSEIIELKENIHELTCRLCENLQDSEKKSVGLQKSFEIKNGIVKIYSNIYRYFAQLNIISTVISDETALRKYKEMDGKNKEIELSMFYTDCIEFIQHAESLSEQKSFMGQLFKCVPFKMGRDKYFGLVEKSLSLAFSGESKEFIKTSLETFKNTCAPDSSPDYGKYFPEIAESLKEKYGIKPSELNDEELEKEFDDIDGIFDSLSEIEDYCQEILNAANSLIILHYLNFTFDDLTESNFGYGDVYHKVCEMLQNPDDLAFTETVTKLLEGYIEPVIDKSNEINKKELPLLEKLGSYDTFDDDAAKILATEGFVRDAFYCDINREIFNFNTDRNMPAADESFKNDAFDNFLSFMRGYFSSLPLTIRKPAMQLLIASLPIAMDIHELMDYIKNGIDTASSFEQALLIIDKAGTIFTDNGFNYRTENDGGDHDHDCCTHEHHHHDGCGHNH
ncbi:hypothetical protein NE664_04500 [Anaerotignum faecicola]|nr:hypothetical protein [Anaerotignum faecicola]